MTPTKWYENIWVSMVFTPFRWRLNLIWEPHWRQAGVDIGPLTVAVGWPNLSDAFRRDPLGDEF